MASRYRGVVIGSSLGGVEALRALLPASSRMRILARDAQSDPGAIDWCQAGLLSSCSTARRIQEDRDRSSASARRRTDRQVVHDASLLADLV